MSVFKNNTEALSEYLQSMVRLEELQKMTEDLDKELEDSQRLLSEIKTIFNVPNQNLEMQPEHVAQFFVAEAPRLLMSDMEEAGDVDIDNTLTRLKTYADDLKKTITVSHVESQQDSSSRVIKNVDFNQYAYSLDRLCKRLAIIKLNKKNGRQNNDSAELEVKLTQLCDDVNNFTQMVETNTKLSETNKNWTPIKLDNATLIQYDNYINKLVQSINEVSYLWQSRN